MPKQHDQQKIIARTLHPLLAEQGVEVTGYTFIKDESLSTPQESVYEVTTIARVTIPTQEASSATDTNSIQQAIETNTQIDFGAIDANKLFSKLGG